MSAQKTQWVNAAPLESVPPGQARAVRLGRERSIALFNEKDKIYATDNQCPHMGYPLVRGVVRHGVLTCDWHGRSFDLEGGGCFNRECDDLQTFAVEVRGPDIWVEVPEPSYRRREEHLNLLWEGLLSCDRWTQSKAIALLLRGDVPQDDIVELVVRHLGRHIASSHEAEGGQDVVLLLSGLQVARRYEGEDRLIALTTAAGAAAGEAAERLDVVPLPDPVDWTSIERWVRAFSRDGQAGRIERCLFTAGHAGYQENILPLLFDCATTPHFLGFADHIIWLDHLARVQEEFGWDQAGELVFNLGAKLVGRGRGEPERFRRDAIAFMGDMEPVLAQAQAGDPEVPYDEDSLVKALVSADLEAAFGALTQQLEAGVSIDRLIDTCLLLAADRMARVPVNVEAGWPCLTREFNLAAALRTVQRYGGPTAAARGLVHAAWQFFDDRWLNIPYRPLSEHLTTSATAENPASIVEAIQTLNVQEVGPRVLAYGLAGHPEEPLIEAMGRAILWDDTAHQLLPTLGTVFAEWECFAASDHPARLQILVGLARFATDVRTNKDSGSATRAALRFAQGHTAVDIFED